MNTKNKFNKDFWEEKYKTNATGWDIGKISTPLKKYIDQIKNKEIKILIPGVGNGYEAEYLINNGFKNVTVIDISKQPLLNLQSRLPNIKKKQLVQQDFFNHNINYDLIIEQTFFCALDPSLRITYVSKMNDLLNKRGKLVGLFFDFELTGDIPPFGGSRKEYLKLFSSNFHIKTLEKCHNSIKPRFGTELFFIFDKK